MLKIGGLIVSQLLGVRLVICRGSSFFIWLGLELRAIGLLGVFILTECSWSSTAKYIVIRALGRALILWGLIGHNLFLLVGGLGLKLGVPPAHI